MVYYGALSRGCERCRKRKIRCDQRKPSCKKCEQLKKPCPGYRDLNSLSFRNQSESVRGKYGYHQKSALPSNIRCSWLEAANKKDLHEDSPGLLKVWLPCANDDIGPAFFFSNYGFRELPFSTGFQQWLEQSYLDASSADAVRAGIEAVGLAGVSNVLGNTRLRRQSRKKYCDALSSLNVMLGHPARAKSDAAFTTVILLSLFETINFRHSWQYYDWAAHVKGATALLELRGSSQLTTERGILLFILIRSQILTICLQHNLPVPSSLASLTSEFLTSRARQTWQEQGLFSHASISGISLRIVNFGAAVHRKDFASVQAAVDEAYEIDRLLETWREKSSPQWAYREQLGVVLDGGSRLNVNKRHIYPSRRVATLWNNWRIMRIVLNTMLLQAGWVPSESRQYRACVDAITNASEEICLTVESFSGSARMMSLVHPLYMVSREELNPPHVREFARKELLAIESSCGMRQAGFLARCTSEDENSGGPEMAAIPTYDEWRLFPLVPGG